MKLKTRYFLYVLVIHAIFLAVTIILYQYHKILFIVCEAALLLSMMLFIVFYKSIFRPFRLLQAGVESIHDKDFNMKFLPVGEPELDRLIDVFNKMIEQLRLERTKTTEKNFFLEKLIEASPASIVIFDKKNKIQSINPAALNLFRMKDNTNLPEDIHDLPQPWDHELSKLDETDTLVIQIDGINQFKCYKSYFIDRGVKQSFFIIEELTKELLKAERQSYEKVIRMMSHEVNNSVGSVNSIIDSTVHFMDNQNTPENREYINVLNVARERIINLNLFTRRFADIVHIPPPRFSDCNLADSINQVLILFQPEFKQRKISVTTKYDCEQPLISFDCQQLELVLINIIKNAVQAIHSGGEIRLLFRNSPPVLVVENTGEPIPDNNRKNLFKPFYTTKKTGQGIGLTLIREILTNHSCDFSLSTRDDGITEFRIAFQKF